MDQVEASYVKQNFGAALARAANAPLGVRRHRKLVAALVPPHWLDRVDALDERRVARAAQKMVEQQRLMAHQRIAIDLLCAAPSRQQKVLKAATREVDRWEANKLCSQDYVDRWRQWLASPVRKLAQCMVSDADGWGSAMRQNSPFTAWLNPDG